MKYGFLWYVIIELQEYIPHSYVFKSYEECLEDVKNNYPEYKDVCGIIFCEDDDGIITELVSLKKPINIKERKEVL